MCGIIGYVGWKDTAKILVGGLKRLEYRGYDSVGVAVSGKKLKIVKSAGRISEIENKVQNLKGSIGIGHTRWATHGKPNRVNAHPHTDCNGKFAVVHNGIIENYRALRKILEKEGHKFKSETDTEVLAHLIEKFYNGNLVNALKRSLELVNGTYGVAIIHEGDEEIVVARKSSPIIIGVGDGEMFVASDATATLEHTKSTIYLEDNEIARIKKEGYEIYGANGEKIDKEVEQIKWNLQQVEKSGYKHFTLKEIMEQPESIKNTLSGRITDKIKLSVKFSPEKIKKIRIIACGTSYNAGLIGKYVIEDIAGIPASVEYASEFRYRDVVFEDGELAIIISQSGETADTLAALRKCNESGLETFGIVNVVGSTIAREVDSGMYLHVGPEIGVASTKAFSSQVVALILLAMYIQQEKKGIIDEKLIYEIKKLPKLVERVLEKNEEIRRVAQKYKDCKNILYLGRGVEYPVALEGALKLKELSYIHAEGYPAGEMKHGPIAMIDETFPSVFIATNKKQYEKTINNMEEIKARNGKIIAIVNNEDEKVDKLADDMIKIPKCNPYTSVIIGNVVLQLFAYHMADLNELDVDKPRNLAKSVTVE